MISEIGNNIPKIPIIWLNVKPPSSDDMILFFLFSIFLVV